MLGHKFEYHEFFCICLYSISPLKEYEHDDIVVNTLGDKTIYDYGSIAVYCRHAAVSMTHRRVSAI